MGNRSSFGNQHLGNHTKALHNFTVACMFCSIIIPGITTWLYLNDPYREYLIAAAVFGLTALVSWIVVLGILSLIYTSLVKMTLNPPTPSTYTPSPGRITPMHQNNRLERLILTGDFGSDGFVVRFTRNANGEIVYDE